VTGGLAQRALVRQHHQDVRTCASVPTSYWVETIMVESETNRPRAAVRTVQLEWRNVYAGAAGAGPAM